jgi:hypothetical protein
MCWFRHMEFWKCHCQKALKYLDRILIFSYVKIWIYSWIARKSRLLKWLLSFPSQFTITNYTFRFCAVDYPPNSALLCEISGSRGSKYEDDNFLGYSAMQSHWSRLTFQRHVLPPLSGWSTSTRLHSAISKKPVIFCLGAFAIQFLHCCCHYCFNFFRILYGQFLVFHKCHHQAPDFDNLKIVTNWPIKWQNLKKDFIFTKMHWKFLWKFVFIHHNSEH